MATVTVTAQAHDFLIISNQFGRKIPDILAALLTIPDTVLIAFNTVNLGGFGHECLIFTLSKAGYPDITRMISKEDVLSRDPKSLEPLFRAENLVNGVLLPAITHEWQLP